MNTQLFPYSQLTGEYIGNTVEAQVCPFENIVIRQAYSSTSPPPETKENEVAVIRDLDGSIPADAFGKDWQVLPDFRGTTYWLPDGSKHTVEDFGLPLPTTALMEEPPELAKAAADAAVKEQRKGEILTQLSTLDASKIRALTDALLKNDWTRLHQIEDSQEVLRVELRTSLSTP